MKGFDCADNEIGLKAGVEGVTEVQDFDVMVHLSFSAEKPLAILDMIVCLRVEGLGLSLEILEGVRVGVVLVLSRCESCLVGGLFTRGYPH